MSFFKNIVFIREDSFYSSDREYSLDFRVVKGIFPSLDLTIFGVKCEMIVIT